MNSCRGKILIANSSIITDFFNQTVIFMIDHDETGAFGLVINKKADYTVHDILKGTPEAKNDVFIYSGGPVDLSFVSILHNNGSLPEPGLEVIPGVWFGRSFELLSSLIQSESKYLVFQGYSGWGAGQLEDEFDRKSWVLHEVDAGFIFHDDPSKVWKESLISKGGLYKYFAEHTKDPLLN